MKKRLKMKDINLQKLLNGVTMILDKATLGVRKFYEIL